MTWPTFGAAKRTFRVDPYCKPVVRKFCSVCVVRLPELLETSVLFVEMYSIRPPAVPFGCPFPPSAVYDRAPKKSVFSRSVLNSESFLSRSESRTFCEYQSDWRAVRSKPHDLRGICP